MTGCFQAAQPWQAPWVPEVGSGKHSHEALALAASADTWVPGAGPWQSSVCPSKSTTRQWKRCPSQHLALTASSGSSPGLGWSQGPRVGSSDHLSIATTPKGTSPPSRLSVSAAYSPHIPLMPNAPSVSPPPICSQAYPSRHARLLYLLLLHLCSDG